ncbi:helix-turn-helix domain-containing protein [Leucothrix arctica]|uniref:XRE family transcriptional regulator n=1 Tax=Leucothrix arctica TaxID=1481894 RepID=A0A317C7G7_9GAMM|nr:XRE family transcriptional regulator [Leucothrix arctica]PWQ94586.1 XRE family transcriptional regulator [Leucothrix arctica]
MFNSERLKIARERRGMTKKALADAAGISSRTLSTFENAGYGTPPESETLSKISQALSYPVNFFFSDSVYEIDQTGISFRAMSKLSAAKKNAAVSAIPIALEINKWIENRFNLPEPNLEDYSADSYADPESSARDLRERWGLGELSISNMVHLLELHGIRVFSLAENCLEVDAYSFWRDEVPFVFLNTMKTPERSRFDAAHELGHLVLHKHSSNHGRQAEEQADKFASAFLMPRSAVIAAVPNSPTLSELIELKKRWKVSLSALVRRCFDLGLASEWHYRQLSIELSGKGYRKSEPNGLRDRETSLVIKKVLEKIKSKSLSRSSLLKELNLPSDEVSALTFNNILFDMELVSSNKNSPKRSQPIPSFLKVVDK